jgi:hypothetical protein
VFLQRQRLGRPEHAVFVNGFGTQRHAFDSYRRTGSVELYSNGNQQLLGYGNQSSPGVWTYIFTVNLPSGTYTLYAQAEDSYVVFGDPVALTLTVQ